MLPAQKEFYFSKMAITKKSKDYILRRSNIYIRPVVAKSNQWTLFALRARKKWVVKTEGIRGAPLRQEKTVCPMATIVRIRTL